MIQLFWSHQYGEYYHYCMALLWAHWKQNYCVCGFGRHQQRYIITASTLTRQTDHLSPCASWPVRFYTIDGVMFPDPEGYERSITERNYAEKKEKKNYNKPVWFLIRPWGLKSATWGSRRDAVLRSEIRYWLHKDGSTRSNLPSYKLSLLIYRAWNRLEQEQ